MPMYHYILQTTKSFHYHLSIGMLHKEQVVYSKNQKPLACHNVPKNLQCYRHSSRSIPPPAPYLPLPSHQSKPTKKLPSSYSCIFIPFQSGASKLGKKVLSTKY